MIRRSPRYGEIMMLRHLQSRLQFVLVFGLAARLPLCDPATASSAVSVLCNASIVTETDETHDLAAEEDRAGASSCDRVLCYLKKRHQTEDGKGAWVDVSDQRDVSSLQAIDDIGVEIVVDQVNADFSFLKMIPPKQVRSLRITSYGGVEHLEYGARERDPDTVLWDTLYASIKSYQNLEELDLLRWYWGKIRFEQISTFTSLRELMLPKTAEAVSGEFLRGLRDLRILNVTATQLGDSAYEAIADCRSLRDLSLGRVNSGRQLARLASLQNLVRLSIRLDSTVAALLGVIDDLPALLYLTLRGSRIDYSDICALRTLGRLKGLDLASTGVGGRACCCLESCRKLEELRLSHTNVGDDDLDVLTCLDNLRILTLDSTKVSDGGMVVVSRLHNLEELSLCNVPVTNEVVRELAMLPKLKRLCLTGTKINDDSISGFLTFPALTELCIPAGISPAGFETLQRQMPALKLSRS